MQLSELDYELPSHLIAREPCENRDNARLQVVGRESGRLEYSRFYKLPRHLRDGDLLVLNDTRVFPARLEALKESGGKVELLLVRALEEPAGAWLAMVRSHRPLKPQSRLALANGAALRLLRYIRPGRAVVASDGPETTEEIIERFGALALPHYMGREPTGTDRENYQTVYARERGAVAAPTAGLHFSRRLLVELSHAGIRIAYLTLHIGPGTFAPLRSASVEAHTMEAEWYTVPQATRAMIEQARRTGGRIVAVGTSSARALESYAITGGSEGFTGLFIRPGFRFKLADAMITNFHMPRSTVLALAMAFAGRELILAAYRDAIHHRLRFLSYGDSMLII